MAKRYAQNSIAESRLLLPIVAIYGVVVWLLSGVIESFLWPQFVMFVFSAFLITEIDNLNAIMRVYSRMTVGFFILFTLMLNICHEWHFFYLQVCYLLFLFFFFSCYQRISCQGTIFYAFLFLGLASIKFIHIIFLIPVLWVLMITKVQSVDWKNIWASIVAIIVPYIYYAAYLFYKNEPYNILVDHFKELAYFDVNNIMNLSNTQWFTLGLMGIPFIISIIHINRYSYQDKIKTKMLMEALMWVGLFLFAFILLYPQFYTQLIMLFLVSASFFVAHLFLFTHNIVSNISFFVYTGIILITTLYNLWITL